MKRVLLSTLLACTGFSTGAFAANTIAYNTGFSTIQFGVLDLTPGDGNTAAYAVDSVLTTHSQSLRPRSGPGSTSLYQQVNGLAPSDYHSTLLGSSSTSTAGAQIGQLSTSLTASRELGVNAVVSGEVEQVVTLTLSAHSVLTLSGEYYRNAVLSNSADTGFLARSEVRARLESGDVAWFLPAGNVTTVPGTPDTDVFSYALANTSDAAVSVRLTLAADSEVRILSQPAAAIAAVPEPSTYAMLVAGLTVAGAAARRRRRT